MATLEEAYGNKAGIAQILIDTYGYTMNAQGIVSNAGGQQYIPTTGAVTTPSEPVATPAAIEPVAAPVSDTAVVASAGVAGRPPVETSDGTGTILVEKYGYEKIDGKYYAPVGGPVAQPTPVMTPGIQQILVDKYDYTVVDGQAYAPGTAPVAATTTDIPATSTTAAAVPVAAATGTPEVAAAANAVAVAGTETPVAATGTPAVAPVAGTETPVAATGTPAVAPVAGTETPVAAPATGTPAVAPVAGTETPVAAPATGTPAVPAAVSAPITVGSNPAIDDAFAAGNPSLAGVSVVNGVYVLTNSGKPLMSAGPSLTEQGISAADVATIAKDDATNTFSYKGQTGLTAAEFTALVNADKTSPTTTAPATAPVLPVATVGEGINVAAPAAEAANTTSGFITPPSLDYQTGDTIPELKLKSAITPGLPYGTRVTPAGTTVNQDQLLGTTKVDGVQPSGILDDGDVSVTTKTGATTKATLPDKVTMGFEDASGKSLVEDATTKTSAADISTQLAKLSPSIYTNNNSPNRPTF